MNEKNPSKALDRRSHHIRADVPSAPPDRARYLAYGEGESLCRDVRGWGRNNIKRLYRPIEEGTYFSFTENPGPG
jgi:hypothetical protein